MAELSLTLDPMGKCVKLFFSRTTDQNETKHGKDVHYKVLCKCCYFGANRPSNMAAMAELCLTLDPMGNMYKALLLKSH